jgi:NADH-quinone oxidoreductase B subunit
VVELEKEVPYTSDQFANAEQEMNKLLADSSAQYTTHSNVMFARLSDITKHIFKNAIKWGRANSLWPVQFGLACCAMELLDFGSAHIDAERKGYLLFRATPRQADVMIVAGWVTKSMAPRVKRLYEQMAKPKYVIAYGECATSGGPWYESYNILRGIDQILPVDVYVAGCPPKPENLFASLIKLQDKISGRVAGNTERSLSANIKRAEVKGL